VPEENREKLVGLLAANDIPLIEDDIFGDLSFDGSRLKPYKAFDKKGMVQHCYNSLSAVLYPCELDRYNAVL